MKQKRKFMDLIVFILTTTISLIYHADRHQIFTTSLFYGEETSVGKVNTFRQEISERRQIANTSLTLLLVL